MPFGLRSLYAILTTGALLAPGVRSVIAQRPVSNPERRREYFEQQRQFPFGRIPAHARRMDLVTRYRGLSPAALQRTGLALNGEWRSVGPAPIGAVDAGRVAALAIDPRNSNVIYTGAAQGGVWKTTDGGVSWTPLTDLQCSLAIGSLALDPVNPDIVYAGTGEQNYSGDSYYGCGVLKSTDGGATWTTLGSSIFDTNTGGARIGRIAIIPGTAPASNVLLAASTFGLQRSADGGQSWTRIAFAGNPNSQATDVAVHPGNPAIVFAAFTSTGFNAANGIYKSSDGGQTFPTRAGGAFPTANVGRIVFAIAPSAPDSMYAAVHNPNNSQLLGIWRSGDGGINWTQAPAASASCGSQCWYNIVITVDPTNSQVVYFGGITLYRSDNGAETFTNIGSQIHVDHHAFVFHPQNSATIIAGSDGGVYRSPDRGASWASLNANMAITQFYPGLSFGPAGGAQLLGGTQDNGTAAYSGTLTWPRVIGGDGGFTAVNPLTGVAFGETQWDASFGGPRRAASYTGPYTLARTGVISSDRALFIPPLVMDYARPHTLYFGTQRVYRTRNNGDLWEEILTNAGRTTNDFTSAIAPAPSDSNVVYVGTRTGNVQVTTDGGLTWSARISGLPQRYITDIAVHRSNPDIAYLTVSSFQAPHVWKTTNAGLTWSSISSTLPDLPVNGIVLLPDGSLYIGTDLGVYRSLNDGASWEPYGLGLPNVAVFDIIYHAGTSTLVAGTHGRSNFASTVNVPLIATGLGIATNPVGGGTGQQFARQPVIRVVSPAGDLVGGAANLVTASIASGTGTLSGTLTVAAVNGTASFTDLVITGGGAFTLRFTSPGLTDVTTPSFNLLVMSGDITNDGAINAADAQAILRHAVKFAPSPGHRAVPNGDANCDGVVNALDAAIVLAFAAGRDVSRFCVGRFIQP